ncbi:response regulator [Spirosoma sp.]|uniref:response regulator n=1 Tax=Spirosoma sp. TaxID=1899569 RepID=UPI0026289C7E|nr:response regulator [Spirosoma sp.]MCX6215733.1 response regulator [Spirosoma sp.]
MNQFSCACVFHVDDDEDDRFLLQQVFRQYSPECEIKPLDNGEELLEALAATPVLPSLILLDLNMPIMGGFEVLRSIRQEPIYDSIPVVILTTSDQSTDRHMASELKADGFIPKPPTLKQLNQIVLELKQNWLEGRCAALTQPLHKSPTDTPKSISAE